jgi:hypothetical protein
MWLRPKTARSDLRHATPHTASYLSAYLYPSVMLVLVVERLHDCTLYGNPQSQWKAL